MPSSLLLKLRDFANGALSRSGFEIRRARKPPHWPAQPLQSAGLVVELLGPSGVGKTETLRRAAPSLRDRWYFQEDISFYLSGAYGAAPDREAFYEELAHRRFLECFAQRRRLAERSARASYLFSVLKADLAIASQDYPKGFFIHDGLSHNFSTVLLEMLREGNGAAKALVRSRSYVFMLADDVDTLVGNILKRRKALPGVRSNNFPSLSPSELGPMCREMDRRARELAYRAADLSNNVLVLRAEDGAEQNREKLLGFEERLLARDPRKGHTRFAAPRLRRTAIARA